LSTLAWETLGDVHRALSDFQRARSAWKQALGFDPDNPRLYDKIGSSYWHIAFQGHTRASHEELEPAAEHFNKALSLYGSGSEERVLTHYRLGKLNAARRDLEKARTHLDIVEASGALPVLGWVFLGFAYLERRTYSECEYYFGRVVKEGRTARFELCGCHHRRPPGRAVVAVGPHPCLGASGTGHQLDGTGWRPRQGRRECRRRVACLGKLNLDTQDPSSDERFPMRATAAVLECRASSASGRRR